MKLWDKGVATDADILSYTARDDHELDAYLLPFDLAASKAHVRGLARIGAVSEDDTRRIVEALEGLERELAAGTFRIDPAMEDGHTAIEAALVTRLGDAGKRVHLGRSRNDQVLVATRLFTRAALLSLAGLAAEGARAWIDLATRHERAPMPGYTHLQRAVPQTVGHWALGYGEGLTASVEALLAARAHLDKSPLGAAAGYGVNLPLDRDGVAKELGFADLDVNPLWSQTSRGLSEVIALTAAWHAMAVVRRFAWDLSLFSMGELAFVKLPASFTTGSSIMPNKRNPDVVELMRAACSVVQGALVELMGIGSLPGAYHRDLQLTKAPLVRALHESEATLALVPKLVSALSIDEEKMRAAISRDMLATDRAVDLTRDGVPFRDAYREVARGLGAPEAPASAAEIEASIAARTSTGGTANLGIDRVAHRLDDLGRRIEEERSTR